MYRDEFTGLYHTHFRDYDALHGRWLSEDPAGYADGLNLYNAYMGVNGVDPLGLESLYEDYANDWSQRVNKDKWELLKAGGDIAVLTYLAFGEANKAIAEGTPKALQKAQDSLDGTALDNFVARGVVDISIRGASIHAAGMSRVAEGSLSIMIGGPIAGSLSKVPYAAQGMQYIGEGLTYAATGYQCYNIGNKLANGEALDPFDIADTAMLGAGSYEFIRMKYGQLSKPLQMAYQPSSGQILEATPGRTTTVVGRYDDDMKYIVDELGNIKTTYNGPKDGLFNVLNVPDELYVNSGQFWKEYNEPWLMEAIKRGDRFFFATEPSFDNMYQYIKGKYELTGFGREVKLLEKYGISYGVK